MVRGIRPATRAVRVEGGKDSDRHSKQEATVLPFSECVRWLCVILGVALNIMFSALGFEALPYQDWLFLLVKPSRTLYSSWSRKSFCVPHFLLVRNRLQPPWPSLSFEGQIRTVANQGKEGIQTQGRGNQETIVQPWGRVLAPPQGLHITISLSSSTELKPPTSGRC